MNAQVLPRIGEVHANPNAIEATVIARAQSLLTRDGKIGPVLPYREALRVLDASELPPCVGEKFRDALAERAIATLADNEAYR